MTRQDDQPIDQIRKQLGSTADPRLNQRVESMKLPRVSLSFALPDQMSSGEIRDMFHGQQQELASLGEDMVTLARRLAHTETMDLQRNAALRSLNQELLAEVQQTKKALDELRQQVAQIVTTLGPLLQMGKKDGTP